MSLSTVAKERTTFSRVWATVHHQATSMWVWPMQVAITSSQPPIFSYSSWVMWAWARRMEAKNSGE